MTAPRKEGGGAADFVTAWDSFLAVILSPLWDPIGGIFALKLVKSFQARFLTIFGRIWEALKFTKQSK